MVIKRAAIDDADVVGKVHSAAWKQTYQGVFSQEYLDSDSPSVRREEFMRSLDDKQCVYLLLEEEGQAVGIVKLIDRGDEIEIASIYILKELRGRGFGHKAIEYICSEYKDHRIVLWVLDNNIKACLFYEKCGFVLTDKERVIDRGGKFKQVMYEEKYFRQLQEPYVSDISKKGILKMIIRNGYRGNPQASFYDLSRIEGASIEDLVRNVIELETAGIIKRHITAAMPPCSAYCLADIYREKIPGDEELNALCQEAEENITPVSGKILGEKKEYVDYYEFNNDVKRLFEGKTAQNDGKIMIHGQFDRLNNKVVEMEIIQQWVADDGCGFLYIYGFPGPDYCKFRFIDYGHTWAFTLDDFECNLE